MKKYLFLFFFVILLLPVVIRGQIAAWDFTGLNSVATATATTFNANLVSTSGGNTITRGSSSSASAGANSFRTVGFKNEGISTSNTDYFQITIGAATGYKVSLSTIDARFAGTASYCAAPGVSNQFAYSLDGTNFTLIGAAQALIGTPATLTQIDLTGIAALQNVAVGTTITIRYYASGQTTTGGWGFYSSGAGVNGLAIGGTVAVITTTAAQLTNGVAASPLTGSKPNNAVIGFSLTSEGATNFTAINVQTTSTTVGKFNNIKLYKSTDNNYSTSGDNTQVSGVSAVQTATEIQLSGFTEVLSTTAKNFFVVADIDLTVTGATPSVQPSFNQANITVSTGTVNAVAITGTNYAFQPTPILLAGIEGAYSYTEDEGQIFVTSTTTITANAANLVSGAVQLTNNYRNGEDILSFTNANGITGSWDATNGKMTLSGISSVANYQAALRSIKYENISQNPTVSVRTISISFYDGTDVSNVLTRNISISSVDDAPDLAGIENTSINYTEGDTPTQITDSIILSDVDNATMASAVVQITGNYNSGEDVLSFSNQSGITGSWAAGSGSLILTGPAAVANFQTALRNIKYQNTSQNPSVLQRTISFTVSDGTLNSNTVTRNINVAAVNTPPLISSLEETQLVYSTGSPAAVITQTLLLSDPDNVNLINAEVKISGHYQNGNDFLNFTNANGITGTWNASTGIMTLIGSSSIANYQTALRSITYQHTEGVAPDLNTRTIVFKVNDGASDSYPVYRGVTLGNTPPELAEIESTPLEYKQGDSPKIITNRISITDYGIKNLQYAAIQISNNYKNGEDILGFTNQNGIVSTWYPDQGVLVLSSISSISNYETAIRSITYSNISNSPSPLPRTLSFKVSDPFSESNIVTRTINITPLYTITLISAPTNGGTTGGAGTFSSGTSSTVTAISNTGFNFVNWTEGGVIVSTNASYTFTLNGNRALVANFNLIQCTVDVYPNTTDGGTVSGGGLFNFGSTVTVKALPNSGYDFANWTENNIVVSDSLNYTFLVSSNRNLVANFTKERLLSVSPSVITANFTAGTANILVSNAGGGSMNWNAISNVFWITISSGASGSNDGTVVISYSPNNSILRIGTVMITADGVSGSPKIIEVRQLGRLTDVQDLNLGVPDNYLVKQNYPNPFNPTTTIRYGLPKESNVKVTVYNMLGEEVVKLFDGVQNAGFHEINFNATALSSGIYIYKITAGNFTQIKKMLLMK